MNCGPPTIINDNAYFILKPRINYSENSKIYCMDIDGKLETDISDNYLLVKLNSKLDFPHQEGHCQNI